MFMREHVAVIGASVHDFGEHFAEVFGHGDLHRFAGIVHPLAAHVPGKTIFYLFIK